MSHRQTLDLEDLRCVVLSDLGPWKEDPGPEDEVERAVQAAAAADRDVWGGLSNLTDASAHLSSPWVWSSCALGVHSTSNMEQPLGNRVGFQRRRQRQRGRR